MAKLLLVTCGSDSPRMVDVAKWWTGVHGFGRKAIFTTAEFMRPNRDIAENSYLPPN